MRVLVTYGSKRGGTKELAEWVSEELRDQGFEVELELPRQAKHVSEYDAVIVGGALYMFHWHKDARRFVKCHVKELRQRPTYFFASGPLDDSATKSDIPPVKGVQALVDRVGAAGHVTFGGRLTADAKGFPASAMAKGHAGDWRDRGQVQAWVDAVAIELRTKVVQTV
jgi:menaquinone-dependent protoporphyrinogen oxidase